MVAGALMHRAIYDEQARLVKVEQGYGTWSETETKWTFTQYSSFHDFRLDEQGNWAEHRDGTGASFVSPTIAKDNAYAACWIGDPNNTDYAARAHANWRSYHAQAK